MITMTSRSLESMMTCSISIPTFEPVEGQMQATAPVGLVKARLINPSKMMNDKTKMKRNKASQKTWRRCKISKFLISILPDQ